MKKLDWYILKQFLGTFIYAILILTAITAVIDYPEKVDSFVKNNVQTSEILNYYKNFLPFMVAFLFPLFLFISTIFFTSKLANRSEIIAILASGVSYVRFLRPYLLGGFILCAFSMWANHLIIPAANKQRLAFEDKYINYITVGVSRNIHLRLSPELYVYIQSYDHKHNSGFRLTAETIKNTDLQEKIMSERASYDSIQNKWILKNAWVRTNNGLQESITHFDELQKTYPFKPSDLIETKDVMMAMTTPELNDVIERETSRGRENMNSYFIEKYRRSAQPFGALILTIIAVCISSRKVRGGSGIHLAIGIALSAIYIMALQFSTTLSVKAGLNPFLAAWTPNIIFSVIAVYYFRRQVR